MQQISVGSSKRPQCLARHACQRDARTSTCFAEYSLLYALAGGKGSLGLGLVGSIDPDPKFQIPAELIRNLPTAAIGSISMFTVMCFAIEKSHGWVATRCWHEIHQANGGRLPEAWEPTCLAALKKGFVKWMRFAILDMRKPGLALLMLRSVVNTEPLNLSESEGNVLSAALLAAIDGICGSFDFSEPHARVYARWSEQFVLPQLVPEDLDDSMWCLELWQTLFDEFLNFLILQFADTPECPWLATRVTIHTPSTPTPPSERTSAATGTKMLKFFTDGSVDASRDGKLRRLPLLAFLVERSEFDATAFFRAMRPPVEMARVHTLPAMMAAFRAALDLPGQNRQKILLELHMSVYQLYPLLEGDKALEEMWSDVASRHWRLEATSYESGGMIGNAPIKIAPEVTELWARSGVTTTAATTAATAPEPRLLQFDATVPLLAFLDHFKRDDTDEWDNMAVLRVAPCVRASMEVLVNLDHDALLAVVEAAPSHAATEAAARKEARQQPMGTQHWAEGEIGVYAALASYSPASLRLALERGLTGQSAESRLAGLAEALGGAWNSRMVGSISVVVEAAERGTLEAVHEIYTREHAFLSLWVEKFGVIDLKRINAHCTRPKEVRQIVEADTRAAFVQVLDAHEWSDKALRAAMAVAAKLRSAVCAETLMLRGVPHESDAGPWIAAVADLVFRPGGAGAQKAERNFGKRSRDDGDGDGTPARPPLRSTSPSPLRDRKSDGP